eukprot:361541-Chlamydomonas_euryale.AAC.1
MGGFNAVVDHGRVEMRTRRQDLSVGPRRLTVPPHSVNDGDGGGVPALSVGAASQCRLTVSMMVMVVRFLLFRSAPPHSAASQCQ